jgi:hypothetical protein
MCSPADDYGCWIVAAAAAAPTSRAVQKDMEEREFFFATFFFIRFLSSHGGLFGGACDRLFLLEDELEFFMNL